MTPSRDPQSQLDAFHDGQLVEEPRRQFEEELRRDSNLQGQQRLQQQIDESLRRGWQVPDGAERVLLRAQAAAPPPTAAVVKGYFPRRGWVYAALATAAAVMWLMLAWNGPGGPSRGPHFQPRQLALLYHESVQAGFQPYYDCHEDKRFAETFRRRQGQALHLGDYPEGSRMLGLSYPGGLSRDTTAILSMVDGKPVMVFVDRLENDRLQPTEPGETAHIFRRTLDGLVFYEVTPHGSARVFNLLRLDP